MILRTVLLGTACVAAGLALAAVPSADAAPAVYDPEVPERLVVFELFNRSESGG